MKNISTSDRSVSSSAFFRVRICFITSSEKKDWLHPLKDVDRVALHIRTRPLNVEIGH